jgi:putative lipoprotein
VAGIQTIPVSAWYRERMRLPPGAELTVVIEDSARADIAATVIATTTVVLAAGPPYDVVVSYDPAVLDERGRYGVRASITVNGRLRFASAEHHPAFDTANDDADGPIRIMLTGVTSTGPADADD